MVHDEHAALTEANGAKLAGADLVEFRIDEFFTGNDDEVPAVVRLVARSPLPCIVTCRTASEGGHYEGDDMARISLCERLGTASGKGEHPPRYLDVELATYTRSANIKQKVNLAVDHPAQLRDLRTGLILSMHDFNGRPNDLMRRLAQMNSEPAASIIKVAYRARSLRDSLELLDLPSQAAKPTIALGMGEFGLLSRILAPKFGAFLTFASLRPTTTTAPGQPTIRELLDTFRFRAIDKHTHVYGLVGWPTSHSRSPQLHNAAFASLNHNAVYVPLPIAADEDREATYLSFKATLLELIHHPALDFRGCSVTLPHKENLVRLAREQGWAIDAISSATGAANTLVLSNRHPSRGADVPPAFPASPSSTSSSPQVLNTDAPAAHACLTEALGPLANKRITLLGAGGVSRALAFALAQAGAHVMIANRTPDRAQQIVRDLALHLAATPNPGTLAVLDRTLAATTPADAFVNCTPVGMNDGPAPGDSPVDLAPLAKSNPSLVVMDTVYNPIETPLLAHAKQLHVRTIDGVGMFVRQAALQFEAWTGQPAPRNLFDRIVRESLAS
jgi:3-dehydroquinate dehydratase/shikimate dehydrogenase